MTVSAYTYVITTGTIIPDTSGILTGVQTEYQDVFGADLIVTPDTPQGLLIVAEALSRDSIANNNAAVANQFNPNLSGGVFLDANMALTGMERTSKTQTLVTNVTVAGVAGTIIPSGSQAQTAAGDIFLTENIVTIPGGGNIQVNFISQAYGPIPCASTELNQVVSNVLGWETVNNDGSGSPASVTTLGMVTQSDQEAEALRQNTLGFQGVALPVAGTSALYATEGVTSLSYRENYNHTPMGALISVTGGATLSGTIWGMTTTGAAGTNAVIVGGDSINFALSAQGLPVINPWPIAVYSTTANIALTGFGTQAGGDWAIPLTLGQIVLVKNQTVTSQNGIYVAASGAWSRQAYAVAGQTILGSNDGISMIANSVYACVDGGSDVNVAAALLENKSSGAGWNGNNLVNVVEPASGQTYGVRYDTPAQVPVAIKVTTTNGNASNIIQAILNYAAGTVEGYAGFVVGADVSPFEIAAAIAAQYPQYYMSNVQISPISPLSYANAVIPIGLNQIAQTQISYITIIVGP